MLLYICTLTSAYMNIPLYICTLTSVYMNMLDEDKCFNKNTVAQFIKKLNICIT